MTEQEFIIEQQKAIERMKKLAQNSKNGGNIPPVPHFVKTENKNPTGENSGFSFDFGALNIPFLDKLKTDKDMGLILGLILILLCENSDKLLLLALAYILL